LLLSPELLLLAAALLILGVDAIFQSKEDQKDEDMAWLPQAALTGLAAALVAVISLWGQGANTQLLSVISCDPFSLMVKMVALVAMGIVVLVSDVYIRTRSEHQAEFYALLLFSTLAICLLGAATSRHIARVEKSSKA